MIVLKLYPVLGSLTALLCFLAVAGAWRRREQTGSIPLAWGMFFGGLWLTALTADLLATDFAVKVFLARLRPAFVAAMSSAFLVVALEYTGALPRLRRRIVPWLAAFAGFCLIFNFLPEPLGFFWHNFRVPPIGDGRVIADGGPWNAVYLIYVLGLPIASLALLAFTSATWHPSHRRGTTVLILGGAFPALLQLVRFAGWTPISGVSAAPYGLSVTAIAFSWALLHDRLFESIPVARDLLFDQITDPVFVLDPQCRVVDCNPTAETLLGNMARHPVGCSVSDLPPPFNELLQLARASGTLHLQPSGRRFSCTLHELTPNSRREPGWMVLLHDVTAIENALLALDAANSKLTHEAGIRSEVQTRLIEAGKMQAVGRLAGGIAHEFNNLLTVIVSYTQILQERLQADRESSRALMEIARAGNRAADLVTQLLAFGRRQMLRPGAIDLNELVRGYARGWEALAGVRVQVMLKLSPSLHHVKADADVVERILTHLVLNARDAMPEGGLVTVGTANVEETERSYVCVWVEDNGCGMPQGVRERLFEPFFTTKGIGRGSGLGMAMVYGAVLQSGGAIDVSTEPGKGTRFDIYLPAATLAEVSRLGRL